MLKLKERQRQTGDLETCERLGVMISEHDRVINPYPLPKTITSSADRDRTDNSITVTDIQSRVSASIESSAHKRSELPED